MRAPLDLEAFNRACSRHNRGVLLVSAITIVTMLACFGVFIPFGQAIRGFCAQRFGPDAAEILMGLMPLPAVIVMFTGFWWTQRTSRRIPELTCPHCQKCVAKLRHVVAATTKCPYCRQRILADSQR